MIQGDEEDRSNAIYCCWRSGPPIVIIGCAIEKDYIDVVTKLLIELDLLNNLIKKVPKHKLPQLIAGVNRINEIAYKNREVKPIKLYIELIGSYDFKRYSYVSILKAIRKLEVLLGCPRDIEVSSDRPIPDVELNSRLIYRNRSEITSPSLLVSQVYAKVLENTYRKDYPY
jgi:hypothetical protein